MNTAKTRTLQILLAEDDAISALYLTDALSGLGCSVRHCADGAEALDVARTNRFDLLLLDQNLPQRSGSDVLAALRGDRRAASCDTTAIATRAGMDAEQCTRLMKSGFADALPKPLSLPLLAATLRVHTEGAQLDEQQGLAAVHSADTLLALRGLLAAELGQLIAQLDTLQSRDRQGLLDRLHKLRAGCGFCGATQLRDAAAALHNAVGEGLCDETRLADFRALLSATRVSLLQAGAVEPGAPATTTPAAVRRGAG